LLTIRPPLWRRLLRVMITIIAACCLSFSTFAQTKPGTIRFDQQVRPILASRCSMCHSQEKRSGGLSLATYSDVLDGGRSGVTVRPGNSSGSILVQHITGQMEPRMPFGGKPLSDEEVATIRTWIDEGARPAPEAPPAKPKWEPTLALKMPKAPQSPWPSWSEPVDRFVASYLVRNGTATPTIVSDAQFARRAYLDIWGLLPPPGDLHAFINDQSPAKRQRLVQHLLANNSRYAEHWISFWNDLLRNDEGVNYYSETASRKSITEWLLSSLESNLPYDQFVTNLLNPATPAGPDGFLIGVNWRGTVSASQTPAMQAAQNTAQIFLGINLKCNSCHDSFISKWKLKDAYSLAGYFSPEERLELYRCDLAQNKFATPGFLYPELDRPLPSKSLADRHATAATIFTDPRNGRLPRTLVNRFWERLIGRGIVENVDEMDGEPWSPELLDWLAADFVAHGYDMKHLLATIVGSQSYQLASVEHEGDQPKKYVFRGPEIRRLTAEQFSDAIASITGEWHVAAPSGARIPKRSTPASTAKSVFLPAPVLVPASFRPDISAGSSGTVDLNESAAGTYSREWRIAASNLTRALGRPIRDQVFSTRDNQATTIQAVELMNGETLTHWLNRGARRMLGELPPEPRSLFATQINEARETFATSDAFDVDISNSSALFLIVQDASSTAPDKALPVWLDAELEGPAGKVSLASLKSAEASGLREGTGPLTVTGTQLTGGHDAVRVKLTSILKYDIARKGFIHFRGSAGFETMELAQGESARARFFVFDQQPNLDRLVPPIPGTPLPAGPVLKNARSIEDRVFNYALGRDPSSAERRIADAVLQPAGHDAAPSADGLADLLWAVLMKPEFQLIY
jgi:Protein of unknown function (DUF1549)/Protein of unknown function (DUF1553)/Planctomycete cytochrome C